ncbi:MAG: ParB/RepB/Spo0J family partition protein [Deltaproteobacteria bacterium]|nr:ParB/RepB/Spo0J family partition protein [Deltaproteobacteria bacterium]
MVPPVQKRRALGKGIDVLFSGGSSVSKPAAVPPGSTEPRRGVLNVAVEDIAPNRSQPRREFDPASLEELAISIREHGLIQPILVRKRPQGYEIIAGERRWRAAQKAGLQSIDVIVKDLSDPDAYMIALVENIQRDDLNPIELAKAYKQLIDDRNLTQEEVADAVGKDRSTVANSLRLMRLPVEVQRQVVAGALSMGHARALLALESDDAMVRMSREILKRGLSVRQVERMVREEKSGAEEAGEAATEVYASIPGGAPAIQRETEALIRRLGTRVRVNVHGRRGKIEIEFSSPDELDRLLALIKGDHPS